MDPQQSWKNLLDAWVRSDWVEVVQAAEALIDWLDNGGFPPELERPRQLGADLNAVVVRAACEFVGRRATCVLDDPNLIPRDVTFTLSCHSCDNGGPDSAEAARRLGWCDVAYVPAALSANFLGLCPICRAEEV